ncbi:cytochrome ubiquinol oxidase subunit I [Aliiroseovarius sp. S1339]|uniref:cytochrome ubiquinol oxidase subunit I n=1 Tax=Aliiroseovarius sp. S1339 TaxID=2936990 RepID=UPI0032B71DB6
MARIVDDEMPGINELVAESEDRIRSGMIAYDALMTIREQRGETPPAVRAVFEDHGGNLGYAYLLNRYLDDPRDATEAQIKQAADDTVPNVWPLFWAFRIMVGLGFSFIVEMGLMLKFICRGPVEDIEETEIWTARHDHRLRTTDGKGPFAAAMQLSHSCRSWIVQHFRTLSDDSADKPSVDLGCRTEAVRHCLRAAHRPRYARAQPP